MRLKGKIAIVTGGANGIGKGIVSCMAREGATVIVADIDLGQAEKTASELSKSGAKISAAKLDVTKEKEVNHFFKGIIAKFGGVDILVNNVGTSGKLGMPFTDNTEEDWDLVLRVNLKPLHFTSKAIAGHFMERKAGKIINLSSIAGFAPGRLKPSYSVAKRGIATFTQILAHEFAPYGVTVNAIAPGLVWTPLWERLAGQLKEKWPEKYGKINPRQIFEKNVLETIPLKREQTIEDIGWAAVFLASDEAKNITGQILFVDGGVIMR